MTFTYFCVASCSFAIPLGDLSLAMLNVVTQFMYTGEIETEKEDLQNILQAAELLQVIH